MKLRGSQTIMCDVSSCRFFENNMCSLDAIQVAPCSDISSGSPEDETLCASYEQS
ncbi:MAG TPA: DUF1540 domain-containing protein [Syntrophomonas wolfei]|uniref:DUF1540 domain-containing protein n=1 Tax=Syntrophomonas wolfei TaxID=863 RepID=A0A354YUY5_9FIRM|nr:DUF1540 domain-containing protein [Syntrophomonas wolfei]